ncbi:IS3 family transposase [Ornithinimicrobium sp. W1679]|uniref:IS3 family transposase n=1 Tax=Ornithinimicrobium sp. W1679 TaxID=3418770 RepID=UPI003CF58176
MSKYRKFTPEYREEAVKQVVENQTPIADVARSLGINAGTLGNWVNKYRAEHPVSEELSLPDRARLRELEREARELRLEVAFLKKSSRLLRPGGAVSEKYTFIAAEQDYYASQARAGAPVEQLPLVRMCTVLEVSRSGYYDWLRAVPLPRALRRTKVTRYVHAAFKAGRGTYGARRVHAVLTRSVDPEVASAGLDLVRDIMVEQGLVACQPRAYRATTVQEGEPRVADHVGRDFTAPAPGCKLVGDITYVRTWAGWLYLATVIDCHTKAVVGWSMAEHMRTDLICDAIDMAATNVDFTSGAVFHSDRGSQYSSEQFAKHLKAHGLTPSMGRTGVCWDNAMAESFFAALKNELVYRTVFPTRDMARRAIAEYIEVFYNRQRIHSGLGYKTPLEVAEEYTQYQSDAA